VHYYPHHINDFNCATRHLTRVERSLYRDLIELYYDTERPLSVNNMEWLCKKVLAVSNEEIDAVGRILVEFFERDGEVWRHKRCDEEIANYKAKIAGASRAGKASVKSRSNRRSTSVQRTLNKRATNEQPTKNQEPRTNNHKEKLIASSDSRSQPAINGDAVAYIPLNNGSEWGVSKEFLAELEKAYPVVDGPQTLKEIRVWCVANPQKRKTKTGVAKFINNWFAREQDGPQNRR
jgi:uncharacterized protein YdaU (DUF1376 family)